MERVVKQGEERLEKVIKEYKEAIEKNASALGALKEKRLVRLVLENDKVVGEEHLLADRDQRVRDVRQGADGALYVITDEANGELWKVSPRR